MILSTYLECEIEKLEAMNQAYSNNLTTISIAIAIFIAIVAVITFIFGYSQPQRLMKEVGDIKTEMEDYRKKMKKLDELFLKNTELEGMVLRSLYEGAKDDNFWKFIWSIRYSHWFYRNNHIDGLKVRVAQASKDFDKATNISRVRDFENLENLKAQLRDLESVDSREIKIIMTQIITKFYDVLKSN